MLTLSHNISGFELQSHSPRVYSYTRFSTPEQAQGDSLRRQTEGARKWTERKTAERLQAGLPPLCLDESLRMHDLGVSAFRGANVADGSELGAFLFACRQGLVPLGSYMLVESLDRVSRMTPRKVQRVLDDIVEAGVTIVTLNDGQEYDEHRLDNDPTALLIALMVSWRAHEESKTKALRLTEAWKEKRRRVREGIDVKLTAKGPAWLRWDGEAWREKPEHGDTVRRIYRLAIQGVGEHRIAFMFNTEGVPVMGRGKMWHRSSVSKILRNQAAIGTLVPGRMEYTRGKSERRFEPPIPGAYPASITEADWLTVRALKDGRAPAVRGRGAQAPLSNVLAGLARCPECGATMTRVFKGSGTKGGKPKLVCTRAKAGAADHSYRSVDLPKVQDALFRNWAALAEGVPAGDVGGELDSERANLSAVISVTEDQLDALTESHRRSPSKLLSLQITTLDGTLRAYRRELEQLETQSALVDHGLAVTRLAGLAGLLDIPEEEERNIGEINAALRTLFEGVTVDYATGCLRFHWRQGGETSMTYAWVDL